MSGFTAENLLACYANGVFPMADSRHDPSLFILDPEERSILPLERFHVSRSLKKTVRRDVFYVTCNTAFTTVLEACAAPGPGREDTWINLPLMRAYQELHKACYAHSVECWKGETFQGGLFGVSLGGAFFGESMVSHTPNASKTALVHLVARLHLGGFQLLDIQFPTDHLNRFGAKNIPRSLYHKRLEHALYLEADFYSAPSVLSGSEVLQAIGHMS